MNTNHGTGIIGRRAVAGLGIVLAGGLWAAAVQAQEPAANDGTNATYWMQNAVEYKATTQALYELAKLRLNQALGDPGWTAALEQGAGYEKKPAAVILDVDETVLDNSEYQAWIVEKGEHYSSKTWAPSSRLRPGAPSRAASTSSSMPPPARSRSSTSPTAKAPRRRRRGRTWRSSATPSATRRTEC
jgi:hypothetical protein